MCNRCNRCNQVYLNSGCGCRRGWGRGFDNFDNFDNFNNGRFGCNSFNGFYDDEAFEEAQRIINHVDRRRCRENRCARQFVCCMKNINNCNNWE